MTARTGWISVRMPIEMSTPPTTGINRHAHGSGIPQTAKYGSPAGFGRVPKRPGPMKQAATPTRRIQWTVVSAPTPVLLGAIAPRAFRHRHPDAAAQLPSGLQVAAEMDAGPDPRFTELVRPRRVARRFAREEMTE